MPFRWCACPIPISSFTDGSVVIRNAVQWAVENGVTKGMTATNFGPYLTATRGQIVCFIYRWFAK